MCWHDLGSLIWGNSHDISEHLIISNWIPCLDICSFRISHYIPLYPKSSSVHLWSLVPAGMKATTGPSLRHHFGSLLEDALDMFSSIHGLSSCHKNTHAHHTHTHKCRYTCIYIYIPTCIYIYIPWKSTCVKLSLPAKTATIIVACEYYRCLLRLSPPDVPQLFDLTIPYLVIL